MSELSDYQPLINPRERRKSRDAKGFGEEFENRFDEGAAPIDPEVNSGPILERTAVISPSPTDHAAKKKVEVQPLLKRGHFISFLGLLLFTVFVYFRPYEYSPSLMVLATGAKWIAAFTLLVFLPTQLGLEGNLTSRPREVNLVLLLTLTALLSLITAISVSEAWDNFTVYLKVVVMFIVMVNVVRTEQRLRAMLLIALAVSVITSFAAVSDYQAGRLLTGGIRIKGVIGGLFENPNDLALHLVTMLPLAVALMLATSGLGKKLLYFTAALVMTAAIICTFSRGGFLGLLAAALVIAWKLGRKNRAIVTVVCVVVLIAFLMFAPAQYGGRLSSIWGGDAMGSSNARRELFWRSVIVALRYPIFGVGMGNFHFKSLHEQVSHNSFTQVASELGMPALMFYVLFMITPIRRMKRVENDTFGVKDKARFYYLSIGLQASLIGYMVASFFASVAFLWYVYYLVGYAVCVSRLYSDELARDQLPQAESGSWWSRLRVPKVRAV